MPDRGERLLHLIPALCLGLLVLLVLALMPLLQTAGLEQVAVVFAAGTAPDWAFMAIADAGGEPVDTVPLPRLGLTVWMVRPPEAGFVADVHGAVALLNPYALGGCVQRVLQ